MIYSDKTKIIGILNIVGKYLLNLIIIKKMQVKIRPNKIIKIKDKKNSFCIFKYIKWILYQNKNQ